jgi:diaminohydroxyphosphoribosylaminopyrimidine deaminase/5-amino-6-(5-phosphoribosylamino)uracil reductase
MNADTDHRWMNEALLLAERGRGFVEPNPLVGAVVVRNGLMVGAGWHEVYGGAHAESTALRAAEASAQGATMYVTLEPCCHHGKTPPCTEAIIKAGIRRLVAPIMDPDSRVHGEGIARLRSAGVEVELGTGEQAAKRLNAPYLKWKRTGRPYVHAKWAMTVDGKIADAAGFSKWISNETARRRAHQMRGWMDAIVIGIGTALADDPLLTARPPGPRRAARVVLDTGCRLPAGSQLAHSARDVPVIIACGRAIKHEQAAELAEKGCEILPLDCDGSYISIRELLGELGKRDMTNVLVEGGSAVLGSFFDCGEIDEVHAFVAPRILGGRGALSPIAGQGARLLGVARRLVDWHVEQLGDNLLLHGLIGSDSNTESAQKGDSGSELG